MSTDQIKECSSLIYDYFIHISSKCPSSLSIHSLCRTGREGGRETATAAEVKNKSRKRILKANIYWFAVPFKSIVFSARRRRGLCHDSLFSTSYFPRPKAEAEHYHYFSILHVRGAQEWTRTRTIDTITVAASDLTTNCGLHRLHLTASGQQIITSSCPGKTTCLWLQAFV